MKAEIKTYQNNATIFCNGNAIDINWDGLEFDYQYEYIEWIEKQLSPISFASNYAEVRTKLEIATDSLPPRSSARQRALNAVHEWGAGELIDMVVRSHTSLTHQWVECYPDGSVVEAEEADNNTTHWIDYPDKEVANIYEICQESAEHCNCEICTMYRWFADEDEEEFIERYSYEDWNYCNENSLAAAILDFERENNGLTGEGIREQMMVAIKELEYGYFDDED